MEEEDPPATATGGGWAVTPAGGQAPAVYADPGAYGQQPAPAAPQAQPQVQPQVQPWEQPAPAGQAPPQWQPPAGAPPPGYTQPGAAPAPVYQPTQSLI